MLQLARASDGNHAFASVQRSDPDLQQGIRRRARPPARRPFRSTSSLRPAYAPCVRSAATAASTASAPCSADQVYRPPSTMCCWNWSSSGGAVGHRTGPRSVRVEYSCRIPARSRRSTPRSADASLSPETEVKTAEDKTVLEAVLDRPPRARATGGGAARSGQERRGGEAPGTERKRVRTYLARQRSLRRPCGTGEPVRLVRPATGRLTADQWAVQRKFMRQIEAKPAGACHAVLS